MEKDCLNLPRVSSRRVTPPQQTAVTPARKYRNVLSAVVRAHPCGLSQGKKVLLFFQENAHFAFSVRRTRQIESSERETVVSEHRKYANRRLSEATVFVTARDKNLPHVPPSER